MNSIIFNKPKTVPVKLEVGDILQHNSGILYMLIEYGGLYTLISLEHGYAYGDFESLNSIDFSEWTYLGRNAKITIEFDK